jgi:5-methyltetrahydrofolate--homocysteine methyltransferase
MPVLSELADAVILGEPARVGELTRQAIAAGVAPKTILDDGLIAGMTVVGDRFRVHEIFLPDVLLAAKAMYAGMDELRPLLVRDGIPSLGKVVIGSVKGDLHDIGKNLVGIMLKGAGFDVIDLGHDVAPERMAGLLDHLKSRGVLATGLYRLRFVTHLDVDAAGIERAVAAMREHLS